MAQAGINLTSDFVPLYENYFNLSSNESLSIAQKVQTFTDKLLNATTFSLDDYPLQDAVNDILKVLQRGSFANISQILGSQPDGVELVCPHFAFIHLLVLGDGLCEVSV